MFELDTGTTILLIACLLATCTFEFVNGFHDTANAVATVIYTNTLKPWVAVIWSGCWNFLGVFAGGIGVAMGIVNLLPVEALVDQNIAHSLAMVGALLLTAIFWDLTTWYFGLPCPSSHTLIGSILGVGLAYSLLPETGEAVVNWSKAKEIGISLLISPLFGFTVTIILMYLIRTASRKTIYKDMLFQEPHKKHAPPWWIRAILMTTCTLVSFFHGSNDGQKGIGLVMLILIGIVPAYFALDATVDPRSLLSSSDRIGQIAYSIDYSNLSKPDREELDEVKNIIARLQLVFTTKTTVMKSRKSSDLLC